jgi:hypothetical protein
MPASLSLTQAFGRNPGDMPRAQNVAGFELKIQRFGLGLIPRCLGFEFLQAGPFLIDACAEHVQVIGGGHHPY